VRESIPYDSRRCIQDDALASIARVLNEIGREKAPETEPDTRDGVRQAERTSAGENIDDQRIAKARFQEQNTSMYIRECPVLAQRPTAW